MQVVLLVMFSIFHNTVSLNFGMGLGDDNAGFSLIVYPFYKGTYKDKTPEGIQYGGYFMAGLPINYRNNGYSSGAFINMPFVFGGNLYPAPQIAIGMDFGFAFPILGPISGKSDDEYTNPYTGDEIRITSGTSTKYLIVPISMWFAYKGTRITIDPRFSMYMGNYFNKTTTKYYTNGALDSTIVYKNSDSFTEIYMDIGGMFKVNQNLKVGTRFIIGDGIWGFAPQVSLLLPNYMKLKIKIAYPTIFSTSLNDEFFGEIVPKSEDGFGTGVTFTITSEF